MSGRAFEDAIRRAATVSVVVLAGLVVPPVHGAAKPVRVFVLAGQSNMQGHGFVEAKPERNGGKGSLEFLVKSPATADRFRRLVDDAGRWRTRDDVWISYDDRAGPLTVGYGAARDRIGPELGFGWVMGDATDAPVLLIKCAWGGRSLAVDFRPPGAGKPPYSLGAKSDEALARDPTIIGKDYRAIVSQTKAALARIRDLVPGSDGAYVLSGFAWHQGWNDRINDRFNAEYESNLTQFIRDIRSDLGARELPFVIAETGMSGPEEKHPRAISLMKAQAAVAAREEFRGNVAFVGTKEFWRPEEESPTGQGYHWNTNAETYYLIGEAMGEAMKTLLGPGGGPPRAGEMSGYLIAPLERVPMSYDAGFSMYVAAWPLLKTYPGSRFQSGLFGTWMFAQHEGRAPEKLYSDIEGGLGWWRDTRFATETPKFIMGGVAPNFVEWANGPGAGKGRDWDHPAGKYGVAQLSPWLLWPPDGLNLKQGTSGELLGYGYLTLPLTRPKATTSGKSVPTGDNSWTLFLNAANFKGPVAFFTPHFWSHTAVDQPRFAGMLLDSRPSDPNRHLQMETQYIPAVTSTDGTGEVYARIAPTLFPPGTDGISLLAHRICSYNKMALWNPVRAWFEGGPPASGRVDSKEAVLHAFTGGGATWRIYGGNAPKEQRHPIAWESFATPEVLDRYTFGYRWNPKLVSLTAHEDRTAARLPEYFHLTKSDAGGKARWVAQRAEEVPDETGLKGVAFERPRAPRPEPYLTPDDEKSVWKKPGPVNGPFQVRLGDGSTVTYSWYRFADQPAMLNAGLTDQEREEVQARVEELHKHWTKDREYLPPPMLGKLADLDPALIVSPPQGMEAGYVPIVTRQSFSDSP
jgi:hypothetical protein